MVKRWATMGIVAAEKGFHRIKGSPTSTTLPPQRQLEFPVEVDIPAAPEVERHT
jgi:hypothetical protein